jgi:redox-regulated HSP33 family molecular chaperone
MKALISSVIASTILLTATSVFAKTATVVVDAKAKVDTILVENPTCKVITLAKQDNNNIGLIHKGEIVSFTRKTKTITCGKTKKVFARVFQSVRYTDGVTAQSDSVEGYVLLNTIKF